MTKETNGGWIEQIPGVEVELLENGNVRVTDKSDLNQDYSVDLHPIHLRLIAEKLGLAREMSASEADALRMVDKLARRLRLLLDRIDQLQKWLAGAPDMENADIIAEYWFNDATLDLAKEFVREVEESRAMVTPRHAESRVANALATGTDQKPNGFPIANPAGTQRVRKNGAAEQPEFGVGHE